jgi:predicted  nucleic acid-binding Zn-ribbon protein
MAEMDALRERMNKLERGIAAARERITHHSSSHMDHAATLDELTDRYLHLQQQLNQETASLESEGMHVDSFEKTVLDWINRLTVPH